MHLVLVCCHKVLCFQLFKRLLLGKAVWSHQIEKGLVSFDHYQFAQTYWLCNIQFSPQFKDKNDILVVGKLSMPN